MKCETCAHFKACKRLIDERYEELVPCEEYQSVYTVDAAPMGHSCWDYPTVIKGHEIPVPHRRRCGTHNTDKSKYCPECGACMDGNKATGYTPEECAAAFEELAAYHAAEQDGTLLRPQCKKGDHVRATVIRPYNGHELTIFGDVVDVQVVFRVSHSVCRYTDFLNSDFGKTVFFAPEVSASMKKQDSTNMVKTP